MRIESGPEMRDGFDDAAAPGQRGAEVALETRVVGDQLDGLLKVREGVLGFAGVGQRDGQVGVRLRVIGVEAQRLLAVCDGLLEFRQPRSE